MKIGHSLIWEEYAAIILGILFDYDQLFNNDIKMNCKNAPQQLTVVSRLAVIISKVKTSLKVFF